MPKLNEEKIAEHLNMDEAEVEAEIVHILDSLDINTIRKSPDQVLSENIGRANRILDIMELDAVTTQKISARKAEVMAQMINAVTNAATSIISDDYNKEYLQIRRDVILLKEKELRIRQIGAGTPGTQQLIVTDRESIMKILKDGKGVGGEQPYDVKQLDEEGEDDG